MSDKIINDYAGISCFRLKLAVAKSMIVTELLWPEPFAVTDCGITCIIAVYGLAKLMAL